MVLLWVYAYTTYCTYRYTQFASLSFGVCETRPLRTGGDFTIWSLRTSLDAWISALWGLETVKILSRLRLPQRLTNHNTRPKLFDVESTKTVKGFCYSRTSEFDDDVDVWDLDFGGGRRASCVTLIILRLG